MTKATPSKAIGAREVDSGEVSWHAKAVTGGDYGTLCGLSLDGDKFSEVDAPQRQKIRCDQCLQVWLEAQRFTRKDFA